MMRNVIARRLVLMMALTIMLGIMSCGSDEEDLPDESAAAEVEVCIVFAPNELGDQGYADRVLSGMLLFDQYLSANDKDRVDLRYIAVNDTDAVKSGLRYRNLHGISPYTRRSYERRLLVLTDLSLVSYLAETPLDETDEVLVMNVAECYFDHAPKAESMAPRFHLLNISAADAARKLCRRIGNETGIGSDREREIWLFQGDEEGEVMADSINQTIDEYFGGDISKRIYYADILGTGNEAFNNAYIMAEAIRRGNYVVCNWASLNAAIYASLYLEGVGDAEVIFLDTEIGNSAEYFPTIIRHYDRALCQWLERWLAAPPCTMPRKEWHGAWDGYVTDNFTNNNK